jgi:hypothetical protein
MAPEIREKIKMINLIHQKHICLLIFISACAPAVFAGSIAGTVTSSQTGKPVAEVSVTIDNLSSTALTDSAGKYAIAEIPPGSYNITFTNDRYEPLHQNDLYVPGDGEIRLDAELSNKIVSLDKMVVRGTAFRRPSDMAGSPKIMTFDEVLRSPGGLVDVQRAIQNLPSVTAAADNTNEIIVRGGAPGENLLLMDNIEIPNANQFAQQGTGGGLISLISPLLVKGLTFNAGAPPAQYGGKASSVLDVKLRDGNDKMVIGGVDLGIAGIGFHGEGPLWKNATFMLSATKSYLDFVAQFDPSTAVPEYWGFQAKITQKIANSTITVNGIYGDNGIKIENARKTMGLDYDVVESGGNVFATGGTWDGLWGDRIKTSLTLSAVGNRYNRLVYTDTVNISGPVRDSSFVNTSDEQEQTLKGQVSVNIGEKNRILAGGYGRRCDPNEYLWGKPDTLKSYHDSISGSDTLWVMDSLNHLANGDPAINYQYLKKNVSTYKYGGFVSATWYVGDALRLVPGIRFDGFTYSNSIAISPRLNTVFTITPALNLTGAFGIQYQDPDYIQVLTSSDPNQMKPKQALTGIVGAEYTWPEIQIQSICELFFKQYNDMPFDSSYFISDGFTKSNTFVTIGKGRSYGVELFTQKKLTKELSGSAAVSISQSQYQDPRAGHKSTWYSGDYDFGQSIALTGGWKKDLMPFDWYQRLHKKLWFAILSPIMPISDRLEISAKWQYVGGRPYTAPEYDPAHQRWMYDYSSLNTSRYPAYHTLDIRFEKRYGFGFLQMIYYFDFKNVYNRNNVWTYMYADRSGRKTEIRQLPFFPAGGLIIGF